MSSPKDWWRRAAAAAKDQGSLYWRRVSPRRHQSHYTRSGHEVEAAVIRATSHDDRCVDYKYAGRIFAWARAAPSAFLHPIIWSLARRVSRTRCWVVALKALLIAHGLLLCSDDAPASIRLGRLPFDLSDFSDRRQGSGAAAANGFSAFVRAYFRFLDHRSLFAAAKPIKDGELMLEDPDEDLHRLERLRILLDLLMQIRPYGDGMDVRLVLEAMDCVVIEIFEVYSGICNGIAQFLVGIFGSDRKGGDYYCGGEEARRRRGVIGMRILRRATVQSSQLSAYFEVCRAMGVLNSTEFPPVERIPDEDINDLEKLIFRSVPAIEAAPLAAEKTLLQLEEKKSVVVPSTEGKLGTTVITMEWVKFEDDVNVDRGMHGNYGNPFLLPGESIESLAIVPVKAEPVSTTTWAGMVNAGAMIGDLIELI